MHCMSGLHTRARLPRPTLASMHEWLVMSELFYLSTIRHGEAPPSTSAWSPPETVVLRDRDHVPLPAHPHLLPPPSCVYVTYVCMCMYSMCPPLRLSRVRVVCPIVLARATPPSRQRYLLVPVRYPAVRSELEHCEPLPLRVPLACSAVGPTPGRPSAIRLVIKRFCQNQRATGPRTTLPQRWMWLCEDGGPPWR